ncbi:lmo0937 family membrane protein [Edaphobacter bradus]|nr:lmo0937 family membrane protein [Edaphobacter bradus]
MLRAIIIGLFILWVLGMANSYVLGGWVHIFLALAIIVLLFSHYSHRRAH